jgi:hypothetical protein
MEVKQLFICACVLSVVSSWGLGATSIQGANNGVAEEVLITVSPATIVLGCDKGSLVTVHTDIPLSVVDRGSVELNGIAALYTKSDNRGNLVGKFDQAAIEAIIAPPEATLVLTGETLDGIPFSGTDTVRVIEDPAPEA